MLWYWSGSAPAATASFNPGLPYSDRPGMIRDVALRHDDGTDAPPA
jgi:hypothetical protein